MSALAPTAIAEISVAVTLAALATGASILSIGSMALVNAISGELFRKKATTEEPSDSAQSDLLYLLLNDECQRARQKILTHPEKVLRVYLFGLTSAIITTLILLDVIAANSVIGWLASHASRYLDLRDSTQTEIIAATELFVSKILVPTVITYLLGYAIYVMVRTMAICRSYYNHRI
ncbi:hypothetical protein [Rhodobium gokarnense]|uniref:DUF21 domain-containing protein n=1 Tax=Rhodobium gokarnense TaxID=364296 RepID=A0ABT3H752_9HYPH|nr:hypothetical protein [Rhodobium gokarnense]MCW2306219.1 hypothetical protein [Rhodobium gokarnense]